MDGLANQCGTKTWVTGQKCHAHKRYQFKISQLKISQLPLTRLQEALYGEHLSKHGE